MPPVNLFIRSFKDGVGRQAASKRLPTEAQELINTVVTVERSVEKRPGTRHVPCFEADGLTLTTSGDLELPASSEDMFHYWFDLTPSEVYLISIDYKGAGDLIYVHAMEHNDGSPTLKKVTTVAGTTELQDYVRYGSGYTEAAEALSIVSIGPTLLILNKLVATGFSSGSAGKTFGLDGVVTDTDDLLGAPAEYKSASATDPEGTALIWVQNRAYAGGQEVYRPSDGAGAAVYRAKDVISSSANTSAAYGGTLWQDTGRDIGLIPVKDFIYPDSSKRYLGQSLPDISEINLPPAADDVDAANGAETMLAALYPDDLGIGDGGRAAAGTGKIYYLQNGYGGTEPGYYIVQSASSSPYLKKIRTPDASSLLDATRLPVVLVPSDSATVWTLSNGSYDERISGDTNSNPGPKAWEDARQRPITAMATFRNRLWYSIGDTVFSSRTNDYSNFFLEDPSLIVDTDPVDVSLSVNKYTPVVSLTPFESYIFVNTGSDVQFALEGSENQITPYTAALSSESFYSTAAVTEPILMGNQVYFFDDTRLYIYMPSSAITVQRAMEVSKHVPSYLPKNYGSTVVCNSYETLLMVDNDSRQDVYCYTNRYQGDQLLQNAFFRQQYSKSVSSVNTHEEEMYFLTKGAANKYTMYVQKFREDLGNHIWLDDAETLVSEEGVNAVYDSSTNNTTVTFANTVDTDNDVVMVGYEASPAPFAIPTYERHGTILTARSFDRTTPGSTIVEISGRIEDGLTLYLGKNYMMTIALSPIYQRDDSNNVIDGLLSLRSMHTRHSNTGQYFVTKEIRGRTSVSSTFQPMELDETAGIDPLALENKEVRGECLAKIFGNAAETALFINSDTPNPVNITQIQIKGIFNEKYSSFNR